MGDRLFGHEEALGDHPPHLGDLDVLVGVRNVVVPSSTRVRRLAGRGLLVLRHVGRDDPAPRTGPGDEGEVHVPVPGHRPGLGARQDVARGVRARSLRGGGHGGRGLCRRPCLLLLRLLGRRRGGGGLLVPLVRQHLRRDVLERPHVLLLLADYGHGPAYLYVRRPGLHEHLGEEAPVHGLPLDGRLVGLHLGEDLPRLDRVALLLRPGRQAPLGHGRGERGHAEHGVWGEGEGEGRGRRRRGRGG
mmetsp:Transcript_3543/g.9976  ORF Transcript_3543/g.9976 Transcript_3543/m.9976 type:complete len:246 (+) Transcript_3543:235-972(+)